MEKCFGLVNSLRSPVVSLAFFPLALLSLRHLRRFSSFSMPDQVPVVPSDGAVAVAVDPPVVAPPTLAVAAGDNNAQNANDNVVPVPQAATPKVSVSLALVFLWLGSCFCLISFSFCVCTTSLVFLYVYRFTIFASVLLHSCPGKKLLASVYNFVQL